jgi:hypothetical protein
MAERRSKGVSRPIPLVFSQSIHQRDRRYGLVARTIELVIWWVLIAVVAGGVGLLFR